MVIKRESEEAVYSDAIEEGANMQIFLRGGYANMIVWRLLMRTTSFRHLVINF